MFANESFPRCVNCNDLAVLVQQCDMSIQSIDGRLEQILVFPYRSLRLLAAGPLNQQGHDQGALKSAQRNDADDIPLVQIPDRWFLVPDYCSGRQLAFG